MNDTIQTILARRSVRSYTEKQISDDDLKLILECALYAPTGANMQYSRFLVIQNPGFMAELNDIIQQELSGRDVIEGQFINRGILRARKEGYHFIHHAPTLITAVSLRSHDNSMADCSCALENIQLAATSLGLGACWSNQPHWLTDVPAVRAFFSRFGLREEEDIYGSVSVGYVAHKAAIAPQRKDGRIVLDEPRLL